MFHVKFIAALSLLFVLCSPLCVSGAPVHSFDCKNCHLSNKTIDELGGDNVCLSCHDSTPPARTSGFVTGDASNSFGNNPAPNYETSHNWAAISDNPAAGAAEPVREDYPGFFSNYGTSGSRVTCSRCHQPHADSVTNPKLLTTTASGYAAFSAAPLTPNDMCLACHAPWDQSNNHGWLTHPIVADYNASVLSEPEKYNASLNNKDNASIQLVNGGVSCTSCHGIHFVDSDSSTADGPTGTLSKSDGKLLRGNGSLRADKSSLCQTCHTYIEHGDGSGEKVGCLVCHSGHSYDPTAPNYFVLRKTVNSATFGLKANLDYSSPDVADPIEAENKYTFWADPVDDSGYCERCHGEITSLPQTVHSAGAYCTECHGHSQVNGGSFGHPGGGDCTPCHTPDHVVSTEQVDWVTIFDPGSAHTNDDPPYSGPIYAYATCTMCHTTNLLTEHNSNCIFCHFGTTPPRDSFTSWDQTCQQGSCHATYHVDASDLHDEYYWRASTSEPGYSCSACHSQSGFVVPWPGYEDGYLATADDCGVCHAIRPDTYPPVVESDLQSDYIDSAIIALSATDPAGVDTIYYRLDNGTDQVYSGPFTVAAPASGSDPHILQYWASDSLGNVGSPGPSQNFTVHADTTPPVTTSDTKDYYGADATIQLTASDDADFYPVAATYYVFDDPSGVPTEGTTAVFPEPASGTEVHTIYFWSVDNTGNVESAKSASFTMVANGLVQDSMPMGANLRGYADPYFFTEWNTANPSMTYTISIIDVDQEPDAVILTDTITRTFNSYYSSPNYLPTSPQTWTTYWPCPPDIPVSPGDKIVIDVDAKFNDQAFWPDFLDFPATYTITLPAGTVQLESVDWKFTTTMGWTNYEYIESGDVEVSWIDVLPAVDNISYITTSP